MQSLGMSGNWFAAAAILAWPIAAMVLYRTRSAAEATVWTILGGLLLLPTGVSFKFEMIPALDKTSVPNLCALVGCLMSTSQRRPSRVGLVEFLALLLILGPVVTSALNDDSVVVGDRVLPGVGVYDGISALLSQLILFLPFFLGRRLFQEAFDIEIVARCLVVAGVVYSLPMLFEVRFSPQLSNWIYGFFPGGFSNEVRYGGFRPVVFMKNGLTAAFFMMTAFLATMTMWRLGDRARPFSSGGASAYLGVVLILCKSGGALVYALFGGILVRWMSPRVQLRVAVVLAAIAIVYPMLRATSLFPDHALVETAAMIDAKRADSLKFRFDQEQQLLERASQRFVFGWGRYGRNRVYEESGKDSSVTDGAWIQTLGQFGLVGFFAEFGLLAWPVFCAAHAYKFVRSARDRIFLSLVALIVALSIVEQLPNSSISSWNWLLAGALLGRTERLARRLARERVSSRRPMGFEAPNGSVNA